VTGSAQVSGNVASHAFLFSNGAMIDLGTLGGSNSGGFGINAAGQVAGYSATSSGEDHAFLYSNGTMWDLGTLGGSYSRGFGINSAGQVTGYADTGSAQHAFLYSNGVMADLNDLIDTNSGWILHNANGINDAGQIIGSGIFNGRTHAFLLTPVQLPEPEIYSLFLTSFGLLGFFRYRSRAKLHPRISQARFQIGKDRHVSCRGGQLKGRN
jgi:probable HAF family extracellular repeat protein